MDADRVIGKSGGAVATRDLSAQHRPDRAVHVADGQIDFNRTQTQQSIQGMLDQLMIEALIRAVVLRVCTQRRATREGTGGL